MTQSEKLKILQMTAKSLREREQRKTVLRLIDAPIERKTELEAGQTVIAPGITLTNDSGHSVTFSRIGNLFTVRK